MHLHLTFICLSIIYLLRNMTSGEKLKRNLIKVERKMFKELKDKLRDLEKSIERRPCNGNHWGYMGATYTRWGRKDCPVNNTEIVYSGFVGGSHYTHQGGAVEYLCMPNNPDWKKYKDGDSGFRGYVYGTEYEIWDNSIGIDKSFGNWDVPCAVCRAVGATSTLMVPAKTKCSDSWTKQYSGYLMAGYFDHKAASQYICVDENAQKIGSSSNKDGKILYQVEAKCGSLHCSYDGYHDGRELTCVVCSK